MRKICILLALLMALASLPALAAQGDVVLGQEGADSVYFDTAFALGDTLYMTNWNGLYTWSVGDDALTLHEIPPRETEGKRVEPTYLFFACDGQTYAIVLETSYGENTRFEGATLCALSLAEDGSVSLEPLREVDWENLVEYYDDESYVVRPEDIVAMDGRAYLRHYNSQYDYVVSALDLETGRMTELDELRDAWTIAAYRDGELLVEQFNYNQPAEPRLLAYDPADGSARTLTELQSGSSNPVNGLAYDAATDALYCVKGGEICPVDVATGGIGAGVTSMPLESYGGVSACILEGGYYAAASNGMAVSNLNPGQAPGIRLKVLDTGYSTAINEAYARFAGARDDVSVVLSREYDEAQSLIENMMNRDDSVDIYTLTTSSPIFDALYRRGYLMELDGVPAIDALAERMYPTLRDCLSVDGHMVALPLSMYAYGFGVNEKALRALGLTPEDVPDNWLDFLEFLPTLSKPLADNPAVRLSWDGATAVEARYSLFNIIFQDYQNYVNAVDPDMGYDNELLRDLLAALEKIDFVALGCAEEDGDDMYGRVQMSSDDETLTLLNTGAGYTISDNYDEVQPLLMGLDADTRGPLVLTTVVAFVNPYTKNRDAALEFMEQLAGALPIDVLYDLDPSLNEPVRGAQNESYLEQTRKRLEDLRASLETVEPSEKQALEEDIADYEEALAYLEACAWEAGERAIEWYRAHAEGVVTAPVNWLYADDDGEAWELIEQYFTGSVTADELLKAIDRKSQMMRLEGN